ncbi:hypothetical protein [Deinococcus sp. JMULE3]|uniref:hypothetical protein n=1 Tax=Deinococcus sp. JMULE3 TaxID=2518341 RepID=UPI00157634CC|nr:hypothetical protein [Deinococcus sp. JMULE3]NTY00626.1 hypothetical protein [Deinococcus sp. JMULE3]
MKRLSLMAVLSVSAALAGCARLIPPVPVGDPIGLNGKQLVSSALVPAAVTGDLTYSTNGSTFGDFTEKLPLDVKPTTVEFRTGFGTVDLGGACVARANPPVAKVTLQSLKVRVSDAVKAAEFSASPNASLTLTWNAAQGKYVASSEVVSIKSGASTTAAFLEVLTTGGANQASVTATIRVDQDSLAGCTLAFTVRDPNMILSDFR